MSLSAPQKAAVRHLVAYEISPADTRMSHTDWCKVMGITIRTLQRWQTDPEFAAFLDQSLKDIEASADPFALCARTFALEQLFAMLSEKGQSSDSRRKVLKEILNATEHVADTGDIVDYSQLTDDDLLASVLNRKLSVLGMTEAELLKAAKGAA